MLRDKLKIRSPGKVTALMLCEVWVDRFPEAQPGRKIPSLRVRSCSRAPPPNRSKAALHVGVSNSTPAIFGVKHYFSISDTDSAVATPWPNVSFHGEVDIVGY